MFQRLLVFSLILCVRLLSGADEQVNIEKNIETTFYSSLKKCKHKDDSIDHSLSKIDFIYTITRKSCHRWDQYKFVFEKFGLHPYRFTSVAESDVTKKRMNNTCLHGSKSLARIKAKQLKISNGDPVLMLKSMSSYTVGYIHANMSLKQFASCIDHISIIKDALDSGYSAIWVMDSSVQLRCDPNIMAQYVSRANFDIPDWTTIYTDYGERTRGDEIKYVKKFYYRPDVDFLEPEKYLQRGQLDHDIYPDDNGVRDTCGSFSAGNKTCLEAEDGLTVPVVDDVVFAPVGLLRGAHSYIINRKGMQIVMDYYLMHRIFIPYWQEIQTIEGMKPYCLLYPVTKSTNKS